jgi:hypothetical protein
VPKTQLLPPSRLDLLGAVFEDAIESASDDRVRDPTEGVEGEGVMHVVPDPRPATTESETAWVPLLVPSRVEAENDDLFPPGPVVPNVIKALSLVPDGGRWLKALSNAHYLAMAGGQMMDFSRGRGPLSRAQTELLAGRVSAFNDCFC